MQSSGKPKACSRAAPAPACLFVVLLKNSRAVRILLGVRHMRHHSSPTTFAPFLTSIRQRCTADYKALQALPTCCTDVR